jgi:hypothetical protein
LARYGDDLLLLETRRDDAGAETVLAVIDAAPAAAANEAEHLSRVHSDMGKPGADGPRFEVLDRSGYAMLRRLVETGIVRFAAAEVRRLHDRSGPVDLAQPTLTDGGAAAQAPASALLA